MKPYRLKHVPTGYYYQPKKHMGSHFSKNGKVYLTKANGLNDVPESFTTFTVYAYYDSSVYKKTKETLPWVKCNYDRCYYYLVTMKSDWIKEEL